MTPGIPAAESKVALSLMSSLENDLAGSVGPRLPARNESTDSASRDLIEIMP